jgi:hypothetical protein
MNKKYVLINFAMSVAVLFAMLFQTLHSYEHIFSELAEKHCEHQETKNKSEIVHAHHSLEKCAICHFTFSTYLSFEANSVVFKKIISISKVSSFISKQKVQFFKGSLFALRAPPTV